MHGKDPVFDGDRTQGSPPSISTAVMRVGAFCAVGFFLASHLPTAMVGLAFAQFLTVAALACATLGAILRQPLFAPVVTRWDEAATLGLIAMLAALTVDPAAVQQAAESAGLNRSGDA